LLFTILEGTVDSQAETMSTMLCDMFLLLHASSTCGNFVLIFFYLLSTIKGVLLQTPFGFASKYVYVMPIPAQTVSHCRSKMCLRASMA